MTDRVRSLTVILDRDMRDDDVQDLILSIRMLKFVDRVEPRVVDGDELAKRAVASAKLEGDLYKAISALFKGKA